MLVQILTYQNDPEDCHMLPQNHKLYVNFTSVTTVFGSIVVSIPACHAGDRGSIPRRRDLFVFTYLHYILFMNFIIYYDDSHYYLCYHIRNYLFLPIEDSKNNKTLNSFWKGG
ncbi:hypothetical protein JYU34_015727 [Plutella xylostella]|uniref:Uncharacterized protein n=1 Tax=Plutella xylostella TaxID=51655 RepID=A0ABQ7Q4P1_PLUXY|nr:hypothetical protein JYU34_015727 [Plutella xylostella]